MKHKIIFHKILFLVIVCIAFFGTAMIYKATKDLATAYGWKGTIEKMIDANDEVKKLEKDKSITEDESKKGQDEVQKITDSYTSKIDSLVKEKESELLKV